MFKSSSPSVKTLKVTDQDIGGNFVRARVDTKCIEFFLHPLIAPTAETAVKENGEANGDLKETVDPNVPKKCDVIVISGRKERCDTALEALKVRGFLFVLTQNRN